MPGVLDTITKAADRIAKPIATVPDSEAAGIKAKKDNIDQYMSSVAKEPEPVKAEPPASDKDKINPNAKFGDRTGEKRIDTHDFTKPLGSFAKGTTKVPKTGNYKLHEGEAIIPAKENPMNKSGMDAVMGLAKDKAPKKEIEHIKTKKAKSGGYIHEHHHTHPEHHPIEHHVSATQDAMADHMMQHMGEPNPGEAEADAGQSGVPAAPAGGAPPAAPAPAAPGM